MTFSRTALEVRGRNADRMMAGKEATKLPTVFRRVAGVKVRFARTGFCGGGAAQAAAGLVVVLIMGVE